MLCPSNCSKVTNVSCNQYRHYESTLSFLTNKSFSQLFTHEYTDSKAWPKHSPFAPMSPYSTIQHKAFLTRVAPSVDNEGGVKLRMLHISSPSNLVLPLLWHSVLLLLYMWHTETHRAMSETGASQPLNGVGGLWDCRQLPSVFWLVDCTCQLVLYTCMEKEGTFCDIFSPLLGRL